MGAAKWIVAGLLLAAVVVRKATVSESMRDLIKRHEGLRLTVYRDVAGHPTIGWGHKLLPGETFTTITLEKAEQLLTADIERTWNAIRSGIKVPLTENQKGAVISFAFNVGASAFLGSTLLRKLNAGDKAGAAAEFARWNKARKDGVLTEFPGLTKRRAEEARLFLTA